MDTSVLVLLVLFGTQIGISQDPLLIPRISLDQHAGVYIKGEAATMTCTSLTSNNSGAFTFYRNNKLLTRTDQKRRWARLRINSISDWDRGLYTCQDSKIVSGREVLSHHSNPVQLSVTDPLRKPTLRLDQYSLVYLKGATVTMNCTMTGGYLGEVFYFYRDGRMLSSSEIDTKHNIGTFTVSGTSEEGSYQCRYGASVNSRWLWSQLSEGLLITTAAFPFKPTISTNRPDQEFVTGESVWVTCEAPFPYLGSIFYLYKRGQNVAIETDRAKPSQSGVTFDITKLLGTGREDYSCAYKNKVSEREIISEPSDMVRVTVVDPPTMPGIAFDHSSGVYLVGEMVTITCTVNREYHHPIYFYRDNKLLSSHQIFTMDNTGMFTVTSQKEGGRYQCQYRILMGKRQLLSQPSGTVSLAVTEPLTSPEISFDQPTGVYLKGETATVNCTLNREYNSIIYFYRNSELLSPRQLFPKDNIGTFLVINKNQGGLYQCKYRTSIKTRWFESPLSNAVMVTVAVQMVEELPEKMVEKTVSLDEEHIEVDDEEVVLEGEDVGHETVANKLWTCP
ncbi:uncharacterized protein LOC119954010 [Scyliorhinus canicula]|uniref:uncharacterized protein LOC119954010 n=1 Tax=Scyliorhinus canicula TaxID=7830 RepID=UPI0018F615A4|nr:uncharacterized protein LOC119954010 [Scyliorhinus canicula]